MGVIEAPDKYENKLDKAFKVDLVKMPHHGAGVTIQFIRTFMPEYAVISVGNDNQYGHPYDRTLEMLEQADTKVFRTDKDGDITVKSDGERLYIETSK